MFSAILDLKVKSLVYSSSFLNPCPHFTFVLTSFELSKFGYKLKYPRVDSALKFNIEWFESRYYLTVHCLFKTPNGNVKSSALPSFNRRINKCYSLRKLIFSSLSSISDVELIDNNNL